MNNKELVEKIIEEVMTKAKNSDFYLIPKSGKIEDGGINLTGIYETLEKALNRMAEEKDKEFFNFLNQAWYYDGHYHLDKYLFVEMISKLESKETGE